MLVDSPNHWGRDCVGSAFDAFHAVDLTQDTDTVLKDIKGVYDKVVEVSAGGKGKKPGPLAAQAPYQRLAAWLLGCLPGRLAPADLAQMLAAWNHPQEFGAVHGICSFSDLAQPLVARLCAQLGYPANSVEAVACARNKDLTRQALQAAGVPTPLHMLIQQPGQLAEAARVVGFPSVLKPVGGSESIGVVRVDSEEGLADSYEKLQALMRATAYKDGSLSTFDDETDAEGSVSFSKEACFSGCL